MYTYLFSLIIHNYNTSVAGAVGGVCTLLLLAITIIGVALHLAKSYKAKQKEGEVNNEYEGMMVIIHDIHLYMSTSIFTTCIYVYYN